MKICKTCKVEKNLTEFYSLKVSCKSCHAVSAKKWRDNNKEKKQFLNTDWWYRKQYGITYTQFLKSCNNQSHQCKICNTELELKGKSNKSAVQDHDHDTGQIRGVLCNACNVGLGHFKDSEHNLQKALDYLKEYKN